MTYISVDALAKSPNVKNLAFGERISEQENLIVKQISIMFTVVYG